MCVIYTKPFWYSTTDCTRSLYPSS